MGLLDAGEQWALDAILRGAANTASLWAGLYTDTTEPADTATLASGITEVASGVGYVRIEVTRDSTAWPDLALVGDDYQATSKNLEFPAPTGSWGTVWGVFLCTVSSGTSGLLLATYPNGFGITRGLGDPAPTFILHQKAA